MRFVFIIGCIDKAAPFLITLYASLNMGSRGLIMERFQGKTDMCITIRSVIGIVLIMLAVSSCEIIDIHPYDGKIEGETGINGKNIKEIEEMLAHRRTICFAVISDTQRWYDETEEEVEDINKRADIDFVIHCGDQSDFGITKEFEWQRGILRKLNKPYVAILGNHDCIGSGKEVYRRMYGAENFSFKAGPVRFICMDTNALEYDFSNPVPDLGYIRSFRGEETVESTIVAMHVCPFSDEFNNNVADAFNYYIHNLKNPLFCIYGHGHDTNVKDLFGDGLLYYQITCAKHRQYYIFTVTGGEYDYEVMDF